MRSDIVPGGIFPDYEMPDHTGIVRKLSELQGDDPLVLTLARGHYCPKEHQQHIGRRSVARSARCPDWDLSTPGLREAWNAGDFSRFHGWDKRAS